MLWAIVCVGLSGVDAAKQLYEREGGHSGSVVLASRRGLLPTIKASVNDPFVPLSVATPEGKNNKAEIICTVKVAV